MTEEKKEKKKRKSKVLIKHERFIKYYLEPGNNLNATKAYMKAYPGCSLDTAYTNSSKLLGDTWIREEIDRRLAASHLSDDELLTLLHDQANGSLADFIDADGYVDLAKAKEAGVLALLKEYEVSEYETEKGSSKRIKIKLHDPQKALDMIARIKGKYKDTLNVNLKKTIKVTLKKDD